MTESYFEQESRYVAYLLDSGADHQAAERLRADMVNMDRNTFICMVSRIRQMERQGVGADLNIYRSQGPGYFENALVSVDRPFTTDKGYQNVYQQPIAQYQFPLLDWGRYGLK